MMALSRRWAGRHANGYEQLAEDGFLVLGERLRSAEERKLIKAVLGKQLGAKVSGVLADSDWSIKDGEPRLTRSHFGSQENVEMSYLKAGSGTPRDVVNVLGEPRGADAAGELIRGMVWTQPMLRMYDILKRCLEFSEPTLLVGETGTGKTSVCQTIAYTRGQRLHILNCNQHTEASDFLGGFRPNRYARVLSVLACILARAFANMALFPAGCESVPLAPSRSP